MNYEDMAQDRTILHDNDGHHVDNSLPSNTSQNESTNIINKKTDHSPSPCSQHGNGAKCITSCKSHKSTMGLGIPLEQEDSEVVNFTQQKERNVAEPSSGTTNEQKRSRYSTQNLMDAIVDSITFLVVVIPFRLLQQNMRSNLTHFGDMLEARWTIAAFLEQRLAEKT